MKKAKPEYPTSKATTWAPVAGLDVNITVTAKDATRWKQEQNRG